MKMTRAIRSFFVLCLTFLTGMAALAQEKTAEVNVDITKDGGGGGAWYNQPMLWIIGAAVFILLLVALLRGNTTARD